MSMKPCRRVNMQTHPDKFGYPCHNVHADIHWRVRLNMYAWCLILNMEDVLASFTRGDENDNAMRYFQCTQFTAGITRFPMFPLTSPFCMNARACAASVSHEFQWTQRFQRELHTTHPRITACMFHGWCVVCDANVHLTPYSECA